MIDGAPEREAVLTVRGIDVTITFKDIRNLHLGVYPPDGRVHVAAPLRMTESQVRIAVTERLAWIRRNRRELRNAARQSPRRMVSGETHHLWGIAYRLRVVAGPFPPRIEIAGDRLRLVCPVSTTPEARLAVLERSMRLQLRARLGERVPMWESRIGVQAAFWNIRKMRTMWGTCNPDSRRLWFNLELAKKDPACLDYIVVHELMHLHERHHNDRFVALMDEHLPDWRARRAVLNASPLKHEDWQY